MPSVANSSLKLNKDSQRKIFTLNHTLIEQKLTPVLDVNNPRNIIELPLPNGTLQQFYIAKASVMNKTLANKYPEIKTYRVQAIDNPDVHGQVDWTPGGFHAMLFTRQGVVYIEPAQVRNITDYHSYFSHEAVAKFKRPKTADFISLPKHVKKSPEIAKKQDLYSIGEQLLNYRLAIATTAEYTDFHGGTVVLGLSAVVTAIHRINGIFEQELAVHLELIDDNDLLIYTNAATDPYSNTNLETMLSQNIANTDAVIGSANYDLGHIFSTTGGGLAYLRSLCDNTYKAGGASGNSELPGDAFWVDILAHELGHQLGATHTFNGTAGSCASTRESETAYEPGSGSTIMSYTGGCDPQIIQRASDPYFHSASFEQIQTYISTGDGQFCGTITATNNHPPIVMPVTDGKTIPVNTPFQLSASAADNDNDDLTYSWEEFDLGPAGDPRFPSGQAPLFRSFLPKTTAVRMFPQWSDLVYNSQTIGELLPTYSRGLNFRFIVRDNHPNGGGVAYAPYSLQVTDQAGPFRVITPNTLVSWVAGDNEIVSWDVANTDTAPVSCHQVDILLSLNKGQEYPFILATQVANDGQQNVTVPNVNSHTARLKVSCSDNVFFDISNVDFIIDGSAIVTDTDNDGINDGVDNCPTQYNPLQVDRETDGLGDVCDVDADLIDFENISLPTSDSFNEWNIVDSPVYSGQFSAVSSENIQDNDRMVMSIEINYPVATELSFWFSVDSEPDFDMLDFFIDGNLRVSWSGNWGWTEYKYPLTQGSHVLTWQYSKDASVENGADQARLDNIAIRPVNTDSDFDGLPDTWEMRYALDPNDKNANLDTDNDGLNNLQEYQAGTSPNNPDTDGDGLVDGQDSEPLVSTGACEGDKLLFSHNSYLSSEQVSCTATEFIKIGSNVLIKSGAEVNYHAPVITFLPGVHIEQGAVVYVGR